MEPLVGKAVPPALHVMSWNIRRILPAPLTRKADRWDRRSPGMAELLGHEAPTLLGAQEALPEQVDFLLRSLGRSYRTVGRGRGADGGGEASPLLYDSTRLSLVSSGQLALSDHPERAGSRSWGNLIPRVVVTATFQDRVTGGRFFAANTHLDHLSARSRRRSVDMILKLAEASGVPTVLTGDLNADARSDTLRALVASGTLEDVWSLAADSGARWGTFPNYRPPRLEGRRLDWVLVSPEIKVLYAAHNPRRYANGWPSDHLPVHAVLIPPEGSDVDDR